MAAIPSCVGFWNSSNRSLCPNTPRPKHHGPLDVGNRFRPIEGCGEQVSAHTMSFHVLRDRENDVVQSHEMKLMIIKF